MTERSHNVIPFIDYRERWPVDFKAAANDAPDELAAEPPRIPDFIRREADAYEREQRRLHCTRLAVLAIGLAILLGAWGLAFKALLEVTNPTRPPAAAGAPVNP